VFFGLSKKIVPFSKAPLFVLLASVINYLVKWTAKLCTGSANWFCLSHLPGKKGENWACCVLRWTYTNIISFWTGFATQMAGQRDKLCCLSKYFSRKLWSNTIFVSLWQRQNVEKCIYVPHGGWVSLGKLVGCIW